MKPFILAGLLALSLLYSRAQLKSIVYDFDGFDLNLTSLPEGDYSYGDLQYAVAGNPAASSDVLGDRVLSLNVTWNNGYAAFGRGISRFIELSAATDRFNFFIYNPTSQNQVINLDLLLAEDDNQNNTYETGSDDNWKKNISVSPQQGWQLISVPLSDFTDSNTGGNGIFDAGFGSGKGMLLLTEFRFNQPANAAAAFQVYADMICFTEGPFPSGIDPLQLPSHNSADYCPLGAFKPVTGSDFMQIPTSFESFFPQIANHKLKYVNTYLQWSQNGTVPNAFPGSGIQALINNGYRPIITWEPMFLTLAPLDPQQPKLDDIINGSYDSYINSFADAMQAYTDTVIIRFMHEFEGDWYPWCISKNNNDPLKVAQAFRHAVTLFRNKGVNHVKWMWCGNSDYAPYQSWNFMVNAYPGDNFVDLVATDIYNGHYPASLPWWRSFRWIATESLYYLRKYFPNKPTVICELGCRARISGDDATSQSKADWYAAMDRDLQSYFSNVRGLIFFNTSTGTVQDWRVDSDAGSLSSLSANIWQDDYYFFPAQTPTSLSGVVAEELWTVFPNPSAGIINIHMPEGARCTVYDSKGVSFCTIENSNNSANMELPDGMYLLKCNSKEFVQTKKLFILH